MNRTLRTPFAHIPRHALTIARAFSPLTDLPTGRRFLVIPRTLITALVLAGSWSSGALRSTDRSAVLIAAGDPGNVPPPKKLLGFTAVAVSVMLVVLAPAAAVAVAAALVGGPADASVAGVGALAATMLVAVVEAVVVVASAVRSGERAQLRTGRPELERRYAARLVHVSSLAGRHPGDGAGRRLADAVITDAQRRGMAVYLSTKDPGLFEFYRGLGGIQLPNEPLVFFWPPDTAEAVISTAQEAQQ